MKRQRICRTTFFQTERKVIMCFKIKHENTAVKIISIVSIILWFQAICLFCLIAEKADKMPLWLTLPFAGIMVLLTAASCLYFAEQLIGTVITVEDGFVTVKHLFGTKRIAFSDISNVQIERYKRIRKKKSTLSPHGGYMFAEQRLRMTISVMNGKPIVLTDTAMTAQGGLPGGLFSTMEPLPDESVPLYNVYTLLLSYLNQ